MGIPRFRLVLECRGCGNKNESETVRDWRQPPPVACSECGEAPGDWEIIKQEPL